MSTQTQDTASLNMCIPREVLQSRDNIHALTEAAQRVFSSTEADFEAIKATSWYNRLWRIITFSKNNEKLIVKGVSNLAKLQDVMTRVLVHASNEHVELAAAVEQNAESILRVARTQGSLARQFMSVLDKIHFGYEEVPDIQNMGRAQQAVLFTVLEEVAKEWPKSEAAQLYVRSIMAYCDQRELLPSLNWNELDRFNKVEAETAYRVILEFVYLLTGDFVLSPRIAEVLSHLSISAARKQSIERGLERQIEFFGAEGLVHWYDQRSTDESWPILTDDEMEYEIEEEPPFQQEELPVPERFEDDTASLYPEVRRIIENGLAQMSHYTFKRKSIEQFIAENAPNIEPATAVGLIDFTIIGKSTIGLLFTTAGMYFKNHFEKLRVVYYKNIVRLSLADVSEKEATLRIEMKDGASISIRSGLIDEALLMEMLNKCIRLSPDNVPETDNPVLLVDMNVPTRINYASVLINLLAEERKGKAEIYNFICTMKLEDEQRQALVDYMADPNTETGRLLMEIERNVPYASKRSLRFALIQDMIALLYRVDPVLGGEQLAFVNDVASKLGIDRELLRLLIPVGQIQGKIIDGSITEKEIETLTSRLAAAMLAAGLSFSTVMGAGALWFVAPWLLNPILGPVTVTSIVLHELIKRSKEKKNFAQRRREAIKQAIADYKQAWVATLRDAKLNPVHEPMLDEIMDELEENEKKLAEFMP